MSSYVTDRQAAVAMVRAALEASFYISPREPGLRYDEIKQVGSRLGYADGVISDAVGEVGIGRAGSNYLFPDPTRITSWITWAISVEPDYRNVEAFDFIYASLQHSARHAGERNAKVDREVLIQSAVEKGIKKHDIEVALAVEKFCGHIVDNEGVLTSPQHLGWPLPSVQKVQTNPHTPSRRHDMLEKVHPILQDVLSRRSDGRASNVDALEAFAEKIAGLGFGHFTLWWKQVASEFRRASPDDMPLALALLSSTIAEGALTFVVKRAKESDTGLFTARVFEETATRWTFSELVRGAASGPHPIFDPTLRARADSLVAVRQRIHAGRLLAEHTGPVPDLNPEQAREGKDTALRVVRAATEWLQVHP